MKTSAPLLAAWLSVAAGLSGCAWDPISVYQDVKVDTDELDAEHDDLKAPTEADSDGTDVDATLADGVDQDGAALSDGADAGPEPDVTPSGVCTGGGNASLTNTGAVWTGLNCAECFESGFDEACVKQCLDNETNLQDDCVTCLVELAYCAKEVMCRDKCSGVWGFKAAECQQCIADRCTEGFDACSDAPAPTCVCEPGSCGESECGTQCGGCTSGQVCGDNGQCVCEPLCSGKSCGPDGCGGSCGTCDSAESCVFGECRLLEDAYCNDVLKCRASCTSSDTDCLVGCLEAGRPHVLATFPDLQGCMDDMGCGTSYVCALLECPYEFSACLVEQAGSASCSDTNACIEACIPRSGEPDLECYGTCFGAGDVLAQGLIYAYTECSHCAGTWTGGLPPCGEAVTVDQCQELAALCE